MKFGRTLLEELGAAPTEFRKDFINYKALKKYLKYRTLNRASMGDVVVEEEDVQSEKDFLKMLYTQLKMVDRCFEKQAQKVLVAYETDNSECRCLLALLRCHFSAMVRRDPAVLARQARWCRRYAELNYLALRKIAKKRDRMLGGRVGEEFMQACFRGEIEARTFMSASLLAELSAIETIMTTRARLEGGTPSVIQEGDLCSDVIQDAEMAPVVADIEDDTIVDKDHSCAICLDVLYQPVSLSCGHTFCARCALAAAVGHDRLIGNAESLLLSVACYSTDRPCPCCRTSLYGSRREKRSPFWDVKRLTRLGDLIKQKYPDEWQRRKTEDAEQQSALKSSRPSYWDSLRHIVT